MYITLCRRCLVIHVRFPSLGLSIEVVLIHLPGHYHHPEQEHGPDDVEGEGGFPVLTDALRLEVGEGGLAVGEAGARAVDVAVAVDGAGGAEELDGGFDEAGQEEDEEDEGAEDDDGGEELSLLDQAEDYGQEDEAEGARRDAVGEYPVGGWSGQLWGGSWGGGEGRTMALRDGIWTAGLRSR